MTLVDPPVSGTPLKVLTASHYQRLSQLLDESIDLSGGERAEWLALLDRSERYAAANAFDQDIARYLRSAAVLAQRDSLPYRFREFARRNRLAIGAAGFLLVILATALAAYRYWARIVALQRDAAVATRSGQRRTARRYSYACARCVACARALRTDIFGMNI